MARFASAKKKRDESQRLLTNLLTGATGKNEPEQLARDLLARYGSLAPIMESHIEDLQTIPGITASTAQLLHMVPQLTRYLVTDEFGDRPLLNTFDRAKEYLSARYIGRYYEHCYILSLDRTGRLIDCTLSQQGTVDKTPFYIRLLLEAAIRSQAYAVVLSHNHPSGTLSISPADAASTRAALDAFDRIGVIMLDHIIVCDHAAVSVRRESGGFRELFEGQSQNCKLLQNWYSTMGERE